MSKLNSLFDSFSEDPLAVTADEVTLTHVSPIIPNLFPTIPPSTYRIALIASHPGPDEEKNLIPFIGQSGRLLDQLMSKVGIARACCYLGYVCPQRPPKNDIESFAATGPEIQNGLARLQVDLEKFRPNVVVLLGKTPLSYAHYSSNIWDYRGSLFISTTSGPFHGLKCLPTLDPASCNQDYSNIPLLTFDLKRALEEGKTNELTLPSRSLVVDTNFDSLVHSLRELLHSKRMVSCDIEGGVSNVSCISFASSDTHSFIVPFTKLDGSSYWSLEEEVEIWRLVSQILSDPHIPKTWQNGLYDRFVLQWAHSIVIKGNANDTMLKAWEWNCEFEKSLGFLCSVLTREPFYKFHRKTEDQAIFYKYCCRDSAVTFEINSRLEKLLQPSQLSHYHFNEQLLNPLLYMELRGIRYNQELASQRLVEMQSLVMAQQNKLDTIARDLGALRGLDFTKPNSEILEQVQQICGSKKDKTKPLAPYIKRGYYEICRVLLSDQTLSEEDKGKLSFLTGTTLNTKSSKKFQDFLYGTCELPVQYKKDPKTKERRPTTDYEALLKLTKVSSHPALHVALELSLLRTRAQMLAIRSYNGRMHCSYNLVGSETGRVTSSKSMIYTKEEE